MAKNITRLNPVAQEPIELVQHIEDLADRGDLAGFIAVTIQHSGRVETVRFTGAGTDILGLVGGMEQVKRYLLEDLEDDE